MTHEGHEGRSSIAENLRRMNRETSARLSEIMKRGAPPPRTWRMRILARACGAFFNSFVIRKNFAQGKEGFILSCLAAMETLVQAVKVWELTFRRTEGAQHLPPVNEEDVKHLSSKYAPWTAL